MNWVGFSSEMQCASRSVISELKRAFAVTIAATGNSHLQITVFVFGSASRFEALPMSDIDIVVLTAQSTKESMRIKDRFLAEVKVHAFDKIDCPIWSNVEDLLPYLGSGTPESYHLDMKYVVGDERVRTSITTAGIPKIFYDRQELLSTIIFDYNYQRYRYQYQASVQPGNTKYSDGATRDIFFLDCVYRYLNGCRGSLYIPSSTQPEICSALETFSTQLSWDTARKDAILDAVDTLLFVRTLFHLHYAEGESRGRPCVTGETACSVFDAYRSMLETRCVYSAADLVSLFTNSCRVIHDVKVELHDICLAEVLSELEALPKGAVQDTFKYLSPAARTYLAWQAVHLPEPGYLRFIDQASKYPYEYRVAGALMCSPHTPSSYIDNVVDAVLEVPGNDYVLRIASKHPNTSLTTLQKLYDRRRLAVTPSVDGRYRQLIAARLGFARDKSPHEELEAK